jgi:hypothetical protein
LHDLSHISELEQVHVIVQINETIESVLWQTGTHPRAIPIGCFVRLDFTLL